MSRIAPRALILLLATTGAPAWSQYTSVLSENTTGVADSFFTGAPDDLYYGIGGRNVSFDFGPSGFANVAASADLTVYEVDFGASEFTTITVWASQDGLAFTNITASATTPIDLPGDTAHDNSNFARSYDLGPLPWARYLRIDGNGTGSAGPQSGFDLDAVGALAPVPEPGAWALWLAGLGGVALRMRRRARLAPTP